MSVTSKRRASSDYSESSNSGDTALSELVPHSKRQHASPSSPLCSLPSALLQVCILSCLQLPELFELRHVRAAFVPLVDIASIEWMQRTFPSVAPAQVEKAERALARALLAWDVRKRRAEGLGRRMREPAPQRAVVPPFSFTLSDARWVRSELQRWSVSGGRLQDVRVTERELFGVYPNLFGRVRGIAHPVGGTRFNPSCSLHSALSWMLEQHEHADAIMDEKNAASIRDRRLDYRYPERVQHRHDLAAVEERWRTSSTGRPLLLLLPDGVVAHAVLAFFDFRHVMDMRAVSSGMKPICERRAVLWMGQRFPSAPSLSVAAGAVPGSASSSSSSSSAASLSSSSCAVSSSSSSSSSSSAPAAASLAAYSVADCVWLRQQLHRAEQMMFNSGMREEQLVLSAKAAAEWYGVSKAELSTGQRYYGGNQRFCLLAVIQLVLNRYGSAAAFLQQLRRGKRSVGKQQRIKAERKTAVEAALAAEGLKAEWGGERNRHQTWWCQQVEFRWRDGAWTRRARRHSWLMLGSPQLHRAMLSLGLQCQGNCGWGGCKAQDEEKKEESKEQR